MTISPFIIHPPADLRRTHPGIYRNSQVLARAYAFSQYVNDEQLQVIGRQLWHALDCTAAFDAAAAAAGTNTLPVIIASDDVDTHTLPWETLYHPERGFLGTASGLTLLRQLPGHRPALPPLETGPLRVLLFTSLPDDLDAHSGRLNVEEEQAQVLEALTPLIKEGLVTLDMPDDGRFSTLTHRLQQTKPHLVFLSGHGKFITAQANPRLIHAVDTQIAQPPYAIFQFEDDHGGSHLVAEDKIGTAFRGVGVGCVVLSACESGMGDQVADSVALSSGLAWQLSHLGIPHVIGMRESVLDVAGTQFVRELCDQLARREAVDVALQRGRQAITRPLGDSPWRKDDSSGLAEQSLGQWCLPMLISHDRSQPLINWDFTPQPPPSRSELNQTLNNVTLPPRFLGRRSELRTLTSRLRRGELRQLLLLGPGGQGKTALAGKLAQDLARQGVEVLAYSARPENRWEDFELDLELLLEPANAERYGRALPRLENDAERKASLLLRLLLGQCGGRLLLFLDNLESLQDPQTRQLTDPTVAAWVRAAQGLTGQGLMLLLTSRWALPGWPEADMWRLSRASYGDFLQMARGELPLPFLRRRERLRQVYDTLHGNGRGLTFFAAAIAGMDVAAEDAFLARLAQAEAELQTNMAIAEVVAQLEATPTALLHRLPAYQTPVPVEGVARLALELEAPQAALARLLAVSLVEQTANHDYQVVEYQLSPLVAGWLAEQGHAPGRETLSHAAAYLGYLFRHERRSLPHALLLHAALRRGKGAGRPAGAGLDCGPAQPAGIVPNAAGKLAARHLPIS